MPRAIQDSDDEGDFDSVSPVSEKTPAPSHLIKDASSRSQMTAPGGTGSTEALQREIAAAHRDVIERSAAPTFVPHSTRSSPSIHRRNTTTELVHGSPPARHAHRRSTMVTYGSSGRRGQSTRENEAFEFMRDQEIVGMDARIDSSPGDVEFIASGTANKMPTEEVEDQHVIDGSLKPHFEIHEPAMFSTSDTVADGSSEEKRLYDAALMEYQLACDPVGNEGVDYHEHKELDDSSPPWSDFLHSSADIRASKENPQVSPTFHETPKPNSTLRRSKSLGQPRLSQYDDHESEDIFPQLSKSSASSKKRRASVVDTTSPSLDIRPKKRRSEPIEEVDEQAYDDDPFVTKSQEVNHSIQESIRAVRASKAAKAQKTDSSEPLNSDDILIGLPKEKYQPRPSRSRSSRLAVEEPIDYSINPEKAAKQKAKRRKTEDVSTIGRLKLSVADKLERMVDMGFSPISSKAALKEHGNDLDNAVESLSNLGQEPATRDAKAEEDIDELAGGYAPTKSDQGQLRETPHAQKSAVVLIEKRPSSTAVDNHDANTNQTKKKRGRPPKARPSEISESSKMGEQAANVTDGATEPDDTKTDDHASNTLLETDGQRQDASPLKRKPSPTVNPTPPSSARAVMTDQSNKLEERAAQIPEEQTPLPKKRGRGRPRRQKSPEPTTPDRHEATNSDMQATRGAEVPQVSESEDAKKKTPGHGSIREPPVSTPLNVTSSESRSALQAATANAQQTPEPASAKTLSRSPASKGKVPYRVGLSKRARIAPLLKIVKKQ
ncbi:uncharacterized protein J3D65DRAFT_668441 [Phyllosticta citribraziliensis]|uniref:UBA domain-containing protein n=1 Tax=Phyllosticta citribraziliensis TaxID=989973 RepID=A0ABR1LLB2_9PEZI